MIRFELGGPAEGPGILRMGHVPPGPVMNASTDAQALVTRNRFEAWRKTVSSPGRLDERECGSQRDIRRDGRTRKYYKILILITSISFHRLSKSCLAYRLARSCVPAKLTPVISSPAFRSAALNAPGTT